MGFLDHMRRIYFTYLGGHPDLRRKQPVGIAREEDHLNLYPYGKNKPIATIPLSAIKSIKLERGSSRSLGEAATGVIAGGLVAGPLGAIIGGAVGGRKKKEDIIVVTMEYGSTELEIFFGGENVERKYSRFVALLK